MNNKVQVEAPEALSPHGKALLEAGSDLLKDSIETGREFCKFMITVCLSAVPVYVALLKLYVPKDKLVSQIVGNLWLTPVAVLLIAAIVFSAGYVPVRGSISLDLPNEVSEAISRVVNRRFWLSVIGFLLFVVAVILAIAVLVHIENG